MASTLWKGHLTFGLVSIPIKLFRAARAEKVHMHNLQRETGTRVRQVFVPADDTPETERRLPAPQPLQTVQEPHESRAPVARQDLVRGFEYEKDKYVAFEPAELENLAPRNSSIMQIVEFVRFAEVDPVYLETSYYVAPDRGGEKPYSLLFESLRKTGHSAIAEFVMHRRDQTIILRPGPHGITAHTLFYEDEVRRDLEFHADSALVTPREMDLAIKLVEALEAPFEPEKFKDQYRERLKSAIAAKLETGAITEAKPAGHPAPVIDIMAALKESLAQAKKPPASERKAKEETGKKRRTGGD